MPVTHGTDQSFTITADPGYHIVDVVVDTVSKGAVTSWDFTSVVTDHMIVASFALDTHTITASAGAGGSITPSGEVSVNHFDVQLFTFTADPGYSISSLLVDGVPQTLADSYLFIGVVADHTIEVSFSLVSHTINAIATEGGSITPSGLVPVTHGTDQSFTITADPGYHIVDVVVDTVSKGAVTSWDFTSVVTDHMIVASFALDTHTITASAGAGGSITPSGEVSVNHFDVQLFTFTADPGYSISSLLVDGAPQTLADSYLFIGVVADHTIEVSFSLVSHTINAIATEGGSITPSGLVPVTHGTDQSFTITADPGYHIVDVVVDTVSKGAVTSWDFTSVVTDHMIVASFALDTHTITASAGAGGSITPSGEVSVNHFDVQLFTFTADPGYSISSLLVDGVPQTLADSYLFIGVVADHTIEVSFSLVSHTINAIATEGGSITPSGLVPVTHGTDQSFTITADPGYHIVDVVVDTVSKGAVTSWDFTSVVTDHTIVASFALDTHTITASAGAGGSITPSGEVSVNHFDVQLFTFTADPGYSISSLLVDGVPQTLADSYLFIGVVADHTIEVSFSLVSHTINAIATEGGSITPSGLVPVTHGTDQSFTITADPGYHIVDVVVDTVSKGAVTSWDFTSVVTDHMIVASFALDTHTITASAGAGGSITPSGEVSVNHFDVQLFTFTVQTLGYSISSLLVHGRPLDSG